MGLAETLEDIFCVYKSTRFIRVKNRKLATIYYTCILAVLLYIIVYTIYEKKGYQEIDQVTGTSSVKLKGTGCTGVEATNGNCSEAGEVYDAMDLVYPSIEENAFFVTTSMIITPDQKRDACPGNRDVPACDTSNYTSVCIAGTYSPKSQGVYTGNCCYNSSSSTPSQCNSSYSLEYFHDRCEVKAWCPNEHDDIINAGANVTNIGAFTAMVKVDIAFSDFHISRTNMLDVLGNGHPKFGYNLFSLDQIVNSSTNGKLNVSDVITDGAIILMESQWNCNLDKGADKCNPKWKYQRLDTPDTISTGFNYRAVDYDVNMERRMLRKLYGIRVVFTTSGTGGKFSFAAMGVTFGAGLAYLGVAAFIADVVLERFLPQSEAYVRLKTKVTDDKKLISLSTKNVNSPDRYHNLSISTHDEEAGST